MSRKRRTGQHLVGARLRGGGDEVGVDVRGEADGANRRRAPHPPSARAIVAIGSAFCAVQIEDDQGWLKRARLRRGFRRPCCANWISASTCLAVGADLGAEEEVVYRCEESAEPGGDCDTSPGAGQ